MELGWCSSTCAPAPPAVEYGSSEVLQGYQRIFESCAGFGPRAAVGAALLFPKKKTGRVRQTVLLVNTAVSWVMLQGWMELPGSQATDPPMDISGAEDIGTVSFPKQQGAAVLFGAVPARWHRRGPS